MARGHRPNTSIVLAAVHGLSGLFRTVSAVEPSLSRPLTTLSPSLIGHLASVDVKQHESKSKLGEIPRFLKTVYCFKMVRTILSYRLRVSEPTGLKGTLPFTNWTCIDGCGSLFFLIIINYLLLDKKKSKKSSICNALLGHGTEYVV